jgi:alcohol dehydrogenase (cytochrome c)
MLKTVFAVTFFATLAFAQDPADAPAAAPGRAGGRAGRGAAPRVAVRETLALSNGQKLQGVRVAEGMDDHQIRTDDGRIHLLRRTGGTPDNGVWREVTSSVDWPSYNGGYTGNRYSEMTQITKANVASLAAKWVFSIPGATALQGTPQVAGGIMYVTNVDECYALDAGTGRELWHWSIPRTPGTPNSGSNRGVTIAGDRLFMSTDVAHLVALNRFTGEKLFESQIADYQQGYSSTGAPLAVGNLVVSGVTGGEAGTRGFLAAFDQMTGKEVWRFWTVPAPGDPAAASWGGGKDMEHGGAPTWITGTYDPVLDTVYWGTGNPAKEIDGTDRPGDDLYSDSVIALDAKTGKLKWYYQFTPHDLYDYDAVETPMLVDASFQGQPRKLLLQANRNGFFYVIDRTNGKLLMAKPFVNLVTWAKGFDENGRPILNPNQTPNREGVRVCPAKSGATNFYSPSYSPATGLFYLQTFERCSIFTTRPEPDWVPRKSYLGGGGGNSPEDGSKQILRALDINTAKPVWEQAETELASGWGGTIATAGGLVFFCEEGGAFAAADASTGKVLWSFQTNQTWKSSPMAYMFDGKEYLATVAGGNLIAYALP